MMEIKQRVTQANTGAGNNYCIKIRPIRMKEARKTLPKGVIIIRSVRDKVPERGEDERMVNRFSHDALTYKT